MELTRGSLADLLGRRVVDDGGTRVGRVLEVEVRSDGHDEPEVAALLVGHGALRARLWDRPAGGAARIPWAEVLRTDGTGRLVVRPRSGRTGPGS